MVLTVSLACVLLVGAGLFIRSFATLVATDIGFRPAQVLTASMTLPRTFYTTAASVRTFHESLSRSLLALPGVRTVAVATDLPLTTYDLRAFTPEGANLPDGARPTTNLTWVHGPYFETLGMTLRRGRFFADDEHAQNRGVVIVNEKLAALAWPGQDPVGKRLKWGGAASQSPWLTVVGVIRNVADGPIGAETRIHAYEPFRQLPDFFLNGAATQFGRDVKAAVLAEGEPRALAALVRQEISKLDRELAIESIQPMDEQVSDVVAPQRLSTLLVGVVRRDGVVARISRSLRPPRLHDRAAAERDRRAHGPGRRAARCGRHGDRPGRPARRDGPLRRPFGSLALTRVVASLLYQTNPYDLLAFAIIPAVLVPAALMACALPAWRAARVEPTTALRAE